MRHTKGYEAIIFFTYIALAAVCIYLNFFSHGQAGSITNLIVSAVMFVIVGFILLKAVAGSLRPASRIAKDLRLVTDRIEDDAKHSHRFLWEKYREEKEELFQDRTLISQYQDYQYELERIVLDDKTYYKCDIEDYIGYELIDNVIHRDRMNQVAGAMTGLGILGTFIGLSLGLQSFNAGTTAEITNSIEPLMGGIKVAFHTSIYGLIFSLVFNYVYKRVLDDAEGAVRGFLGAYRKYVMPDTATDGVNRLMELQQQQTEAIVNLSDTVANQLGRTLRDMLEPQFDHFSQIIEDFANVATRNQTEQLKRVVSAFIQEMNRSLGDYFTQLSTTISGTIELQKNNEKQMQDLFEKSVGTAENMNVVATQTSAVAGALQTYADKVLSMERHMSEAIELLRQQNESNRMMLTGAGQYMSDLERYRQSLDLSQASYDDRLRAQEERLKELQRLAEIMPSEVNETFNIINENLQVVENHFKDTIEHINKTLAHVPDVVDYSARGMEESNERLIKAVGELNAALGRLEAVYGSRRM